MSSKDTCDSLLIDNETGKQNKLPESTSDRYAPTALAVSEAKQIADSLCFMSRRDALLSVCNTLRQMLDVDRIRLYEYVDSGDCGPLFRGVVEIGGLYANFPKLELPLAADWYSRHTVEHCVHAEPILYPPENVHPEPPRFVPHAFWRNQEPKQWIDILLMRRHHIIGKLSVDNFLHPEKPLPISTLHCRMEIDGVLSSMRECPASAPSSTAVEAHRRRIMLNDLSVILQNMVSCFNLDRARAYEYNASTKEFEARASVGFTADPLFCSFKQPFHLSVTPEDPLSYLTFHTQTPRVCRRNEESEFQGRPVSLTFNCDERLGSSEVDCLLEIPLMKANGVVGKITADNRNQDPTGENETLDSIMRDRRAEVEYFMHMGGLAISQANDYAQRFHWCDRFRFVADRLSPATKTVTLALITALVAGIASGLVACLFN